MLLLHQVGSVKIGEVVRYHVTYTPSQDRILPSPEHLYVRIRNTSAIALRAAFVHGPYTLAVAAWPSNFDPNEKFEDPRRYGVPEFEPMVKAGGSWECELTVPDDIRQSAGTGSHGGFGKSPEHDSECASWVIEVSSQVIFSTSAAVGYEVVVARDKKSLNLGLSLPVVGNQAQAPQPGRVADHQQSIGAKDGHHPAQTKGVFSRAVKITVEDTASLWNTPRLPSWDDAGQGRVKHRHTADEPVESMAKVGDPGTKEKDADSKPRKQKKVHLVVLTHGLHSNLGSDMLFMKESIDAAAKKAKVDAKARRARERAARGRPSTAASSASTSSAKPGDQKTEDQSGPESPKASNDVKDDDEKSEEQTETSEVTTDTQGPASEEEEDDDEEVIVRGYSGNATKTERGIKYLGKRLARYVLSMTYPDQPYLPMGKEAVEAVTHNRQHTNDLHASHKHSTIHSDAHRERHAKQDRPYRITSISFIGHSLGGLVQTYAVAYIQKHSPEFFELIKPINFIALATPFLGLSNENPVYVRFALDFGLVGRTGKDLGLAWRAPTIARSGWGAIVGNLGETAHKKVYGESQPESKPLLRILPTGPAHRALRKFRNRTAYSNVVNDGIVPLRTSCLLFLDWHGLGRVEKARRDAGLVETMVGFGWAELTGANLATPRQKQLLAARDQPVQANDEQPISGDTTPKGKNLSQVPQPADDAVIEDDRQSLEHTASTPHTEGANSDTSDMIANGPLSGFFNFFKSNEPPKQQITSQKQKKAFRSGQVKPSDDALGTSPPSPGTASPRPGKATTGHDLDDDTENMNAPPRTTFFEAAGDLLNPKLPDVEYLLDPSKRARTIFHDRVYHPSDIPPPPLKKRQSTLSRRAFSRGSSSSQQSHVSQQSQSSATSSPYPTTSKDDSMESARDYDNSSHGQGDEVVDSSNMRVEEKIARAYHRDLSWRKVLVKLEPDAHNNMIVRRMFLNAYGWPVVKHIVDAHFSDSAVARSRDEDEYLGERALDPGQPPDEHGGETRSVPTGRILVTAPIASPEQRSESEAQEALDHVPDLPALNTSSLPKGVDGKDYADSLSPPTPSRRGIDRYDSATWSDRDFQDSDNDSDNDGSLDGSRSPGGAKGGESSKDSTKWKKGHEKSVSQDWNWTEKIVGKGDVRRK